MNSYTPGPWHVAYYNRNVPPHVKIAFAPVDVLIGKRSLRVANDHSGDADARLIATAPELLETLKHAVNALRDYIETIERANPMTSLNYGKSVLRSADTVIAKAEGRE